MRKEETLIISGKTFHVKQLPATVAVKLQIELLRMLKEGDSDTAAVEKGAEAIMSVFAKLDADKVIAFLKTLLHKTPCVTNEDKKPLDIDEEFTGNLLDLYELACKVLVINFKDFFLGLASRIEKVAKETKATMKD